MSVRKALEALHYLHERSLRVPRAVYAPRDAAPNGWIWGGYSRGTVHRNTAAVLRDLKTRYVEFLEANGLARGFSTILTENELVVFVSRFMVDAYGRWEDPPALVTYCAGDHRRVPEREAEFRYFAEGDEGAPLFHEESGVLQLAGEDHLVTSWSTGEASWLFMELPVHRLVKAFLDYDVGRHLEGTGAGFMLPWGDAWPRDEFWAYTT